MKLFIICFAFLFVWMILSQIIAWMIAGHDPDKALEMWWCVFLAPIMLLILGLAWFERLSVHAQHEAGQRAKLPVRKPSDDLRDYLP